MSDNYMCVHLLIDKLYNKHSVLLKQLNLTRLYEFINIRFKGLNLVTKVTVVLAMMV